VTRERALPALDAAHIRLRSDVHRLFDAGYVTVTPQYVVEVSHRVRDDFDDGGNHLRLHGEGIVVPEREGWRRFRG